VSAIRTSGNQMGQYLENTADEVGLPISAFSSIFGWSVRHKVEHCHAGELLCRTFAHNVALFLLMLGSNASIEIDIDLV